jgi:hypothetical protein
MQVTVTMSRDLPSSKRSSDSTGDRSEDGWAVGDEMEEALRGEWTACPSYTKYADLRHDLVSGSDVKADS